MGKIRKRVIEKYDTEEKRKEIFKEIVNTAIEMENCHRSRYEIPGRNKRIKAGTCPDKAGY